jgi:hypothetical protein
MDCNLSVGGGRGLPARGRRRTRQRAREEEDAAASLKKKADSLTSAIESHRIVLHHHLIDSVAKDPREGSTGGQLRREGGAPAVRGERQGRLLPPRSCPAPPCPWPTGAGAKQRESTF